MASIFEEGPDSQFSKIFIHTGADSNFLQHLQFIDLDCLASDKGQQKAMTEVDPCRRDGDGKLLIVQTVVVHIRDREVEAVQ